MGIDGIVAYIWLDGVGISRALSYNWASAGEWRCADGQSDGGIMGFHGYLGGLR